MIEVLPELLIAPLLVGGSTAACRRWGEQIGGMLSAFPAVVGPVLLILALERGPAFTARAANGTLLGLAALAGFVLAYSGMAPHTRWPVSLAVAWVCTGAIAACIFEWGQGLAFPDGLVAATISVAVAYRLMPPSPASARQPEMTRARRDLPLRMAATAALVVVLTGATELLGPLIGGALAALPILASVLATFTHRDQGPPATIALLRGMLAGLPCFVAFCTAVAMLVAPLGVPLAFSAATVAAVALHATTLAGSQPTVRTDDHGQSVWGRLAVGNSAPPPYATAIVGS
jgi:hypothetical protein